MICQSINKLFNYISKKIKFFDIHITDQCCLKELKNAIYNVESGNTNINIVLN